jgi:hypothetical protein
MQRKKKIVLCLRDLVHTNLIAESFQPISAYAANNQQLFNFPERWVLSSILQDPSCNGLANSGQHSQLLKRRLIDVDSPRYSSFV